MCKSLFGKNEDVIDSIKIKEMLTIFYLLYYIYSIKFTWQWASNYSAFSSLYFQILKWPQLMIMSNICINVFLQLAFNFCPLTLFPNSFPNSPNTPAQILPQNWMAYLALPSAFKLLFNEI